MDTVQAIREGLAQDSDMTSVMCYMFTLVAIWMEQRGKRRAECHGGSLCCDPGKRSDGWGPALFSEKDYGLGGSVQRRGNLEKGCFLLCARRGEEKERGQMEVDL